MVTLFLRLWAVPYTAGVLCPRHTQPDLRVVRTDLPPPLSPEAGGQTGCTGSLSLSKIKTCETPELLTLFERAVGSV